MYSAITCLGFSHDPRLAALAAILCVVSVLGAVTGFRRAVATKGRFRTAWLVAAAVVGGTGVWSTHFLGMLAFQPGLPLSFELWRTLASLALAVAGFGLGYGLLMGRTGGGRPAMAGLTIGGSIAAMHFTGMSAMLVAADLSWNAGLVVLAIGACLLLSVAAMRALSGRKAAWAAAWLTLAILILHFGSMGAVILTPNGGVGPRSDALDRVALVIAVAGVNSLILSVGGVILAMRRMAVRATLASLASALDSAPSAIAFFDADGRMMFWNRRFAEALKVIDVTPGEQVRLKAVREALAAADWISPEVRDRVRAGQAFDAEGNHDLDALLTPDGRWMQVATGQTRDGGAVVVVNDITNERRARELADQANRGKSEFLANMSHEIRTPLNGILGMAQVMAMNPLEPDQKGRVDAIRESGEGLLQVLNGVLDLARIEAGRMTIDPHPFELGDMVRAACAPFEAVAAAKGVGFSAAVDPEAAGTWLADGMRLRQVLGNLVSNAVKFTSRGHVEVTVGATATGLGFVVRDTGEGIAEGDLPKLFEKFSQADATVSRRFGGSGLGLAISRQLVGLMGGRLDVASRAGEGSTFSFETPAIRQAAERDDGPAADDARVEPDGRGLSILAVDDNLTNRQVIAAMLEALGAEVVLAQSGVDAIAAFETQVFDVVLMDIQMPGMGGVEATRIMREGERRRAVAATPILAVTANVMTHQTEEYLAAGMNGVIAKPIDLARLVSGIESALSEAHVMDAAA